MASTEGEESERNVYCGMANNTLTEMTCEWYLSFTKDPSPGGFPDIPAGESVSLDQVQVKGAVMYSGYNKENDHCAWLLAWHGPVTYGNDALRKAYVACGLKSVIAKMTPEEIEQKLDNGFRFVNAIDPTTMTAINGSVIGSVPNDSANVWVNFELVDPDHPTSITTPQ